VVKISSHVSSRDGKTEFCSSRGKLRCLNPVFTAVQEGNLAFLSIKAEIKRA